MDDSNSNDDEDDYEDDDDRQLQQNFVGVPPPRRISEPHIRKGDSESSVELMYKVKEDSQMHHNSSMGTNQSERSGSTFSLPGNWSNNEGNAKGHQNARLPVNSSPKSQFHLMHHQQQSPKSQTMLLRHSNSQALLPCQPLMIGQRFNAQRARNHANLTNPQYPEQLLSEAAVDNSGSIHHFTMEEETSGAENATSRDGCGSQNHQSKPALQLLHTPQATQGSAERHSLTAEQQRGRFRPSFAAFSSNWSSSGSEGRGFGPQRKTANLAAEQQTLSPHSLRGGPMPNIQNNNLTAQQ